MIPEVSIIIPNYNHAKFLKQRIDSVLNQTFQDFEVIILDDCSKDTSREVIETYRNHEKISQIVYNNTNSGSPFKQWEKGVKLAKGKYIWIAESDDYADSEFLAKLTTALKGNSSLDLIYCQSFDVNENGGKLESRLRWTSNFSNNIWLSSFTLSGEEFMRYLYKKNVIPNASACLCKKNVLESTLEKLSTLPKFTMCGDWFIWILMADEVDFKIHFVSEHLNFFRQHQHSTRVHDSRQKQLIRILEEARIFNTFKLRLSKKLIQKKNKDLRTRWFSIFRFKQLNLGFFSITNVLKINKILLSLSYIIYKARNRW